MTREARRVADPEAGRYIIDFAHSLGCMHALGFESAKGTLDSLRVECAKNRAAEYGLVEQFRLGQRHENAR